MASSPRPDRLSALQRDLLRAFFQHDAELFLTGGAALVGFWSGHRTTDDLDLFGFAGADLERAVRSLRLAADQVGASLRSMETHPDFRRFLAERAGERCKVDLVVDRVPPIEPGKVLIDGVRVDSPRELAANKVCALVGRAEIRDLVDLRALLELGVPLEQALADALAKDGGADPATLAWLLDQLVIGPEARLPGVVDPADLARFRDGLVIELRGHAARMAQR
jgi:hypothetical protein